MRVQLAGDVHSARHVAGIKYLVGALVRFQRVDKAHEMEARREHECPVRRLGKPHRPQNRRLVDVESAGLRVAADDVKQTGLVGGDRKRDIQRLEPSHQPGGHRIAESGRAFRRFTPSRKGLAGSSPPAARNHTADLRILQLKSS
jgi:hypothetical protein